MIECLEMVLICYVYLIVCDLYVDVLDLVGGGVVGGMGVVLYVFCGVQLWCGIEIVIDVFYLEVCFVDVDLVIIGEGCIDSQIIYGKVFIGVVNIVKWYNKLVIGIVGSLMVDVGVVYEYGFDVVFSVIYIICMLEDVLKNVSENV